jgi:hypothetical protein
MEVQPPKRSRTKHLVVRLNEHEREMLDVVADHLRLPSASEAFRYLLRRAFDDMLKQPVARRGVTT